MAQETLFAVMIFVVVLLMSQAFVAPVMGARRAARHRLRERINVLGGTTEGQMHASLVRQKYLQQLTPLQRRLESLPYMDRLASLISQAGLDYPAHKVILISLGLATLAGLLTLGKTESYVLSLLAVLFGASLPPLYIQTRRAKRLRKFEEQLPDALSVVSRSLKAGLPFSESIKMVASEMEAPVGDEFGRVFAELNYGGDVRSALFGMLERVPSIAVMAVVTAVLIERETGGNMADVLERIANLIRQRFRFQRSVRTLTSEGRGTAWVVAIAPFALAAVLEMMKPGWITDLIADPLGQRLFIGAFCLMVVGILWLRRLVNIDV
jgi:tight adherence protein B